MGKIIKNGIEYVGGGGASTAENVSYDNTSSGMTATDVQGAVDEINNFLTASDNTPFRFGVNENGEYGYIITDEAGADSVIPFKTGEGGSGEKELLWTNPSFTTGFSAQTLALDLKDYDGVLIQCNWTTDTKYGRSTPHANTYSFVTKGTTGRLTGVGIGTTGGDSGIGSSILSTFRNATVNDDGVTFTGGFSDTTLAKDGCCIPCYIWGVKFGGYQTSDKYLRYNATAGYIQALNKLGEWVNVYATDKLPLDAQIILCKQGDVANVPIDYKYLLDYGDEAYLANNGTAKLNSDGSVYCNKANNNYGCCAFGSKNLIDLTPFSKITFKSDRYSCTIDISTLTGNYYVAGGQIKGGYFTANNQAQFGVQVRTAKSGGTLAKGALSDVFTGTRDCTVTEFIIS